MATPKIAPCVEEIRELLGINTDRDQYYAELSARRAGEHEAALERIRAAHLAWVESEETHHHLRALRSSVESEGVR